MLNLGEPQTVTTPDGREWNLGRLELHVIRGWKDWVKSQVGDPFATVERYLGKIGDVHLMPLLKEAEEIKRQLQSFSIGCPLAARFMTEEGTARLCSLLMKGAHPTHTEEEAFAVGLVFLQDVATRLEKAQGTVPNAGGPEASRAEPTGGTSTAA